MRIGHGYDVHRFCKGDFIILGGVKIPHTHSLLAHSDGDVLIHALCDALLGACGLGDIGKHFPDTDQAYAGADSRDLLRDVYKKVKAMGYCLANADMTVIAESPKLSLHSQLMCNNIAEDLQLSPNQINIKATTTETLGFTGRKEGIAAHAVILLQVQ